MSGRLTIQTQRLRLTALTAEALDAWVRADVADLRSQTGVDFAAGAPVPPLFERDLPAFRDRMSEDSGDLGWWAWLVSAADSNLAVGVCGLGGRPESGCVVLGYSVYPEAQGRGYATEAAGALVRWAMTHADVTAVRASVPTWNAASGAVAERLGMRVVALETTDDEGEVSVYELVREDLAPR